MSKLPNADDFRSQIEKIKVDKKSEGAEFVDIVSGELHKMLGGYPSNNHRMATCCEVMYSMKKPSDEVLYAPPKGKGATLKIRYYL
ncbi:hypothetical protein RZN22_07830 [Bacillaceae bacterium S4-13-58]